METPSLGVLHMLVHTAGTPANDANDGDERAHPWDDVMTARRGGGSGLNGRIATATRHYSPLSSYPEGFYVCGTSRSRPQAADPTPPSSWNVPVPCSSGDQDVTPSD